MAACDWVLYLTGLAMILSSVQSTPVIIPTNSGFLQGDAGAVSKFLSVPYAEFPGRFKKATELKKWTG